MTSQKCSRFGTKRILDIFPWRLSKLSWTSLNLTACSRGSAGACVSLTHSCGENAHGTLGIRVTTSDTNSPHGELSGKCFRNGLWFHSVAFACKKHFCPTLTQFLSSQKYLLQFSTGMVNILCMPRWKHF